MSRNKFQRLSEEDKEVVRKLTAEGKSLNKISQLMNLNKSTIYYNVLKFKPKVNREINLKYLSEEQIGELIGAFAGDGSYYHQKYNPLKNNSTQHRIRYHLSLRSDLEYSTYLITLLTKINLNPCIIKKEEVGRLDLSISSKSFIGAIKKYLLWEESKTSTICLKEKINRYKGDFLRGFARGLMDTDGYVEISNVSCACISKNLISNLTGIFDRFKIKYKLTEKVKEGRQKLFLVRVYSASLDNYLRTIGFSNPYKLEALGRILKKRHSKD